MQTVLCELSESVVLDGRWILTVLDVDGPEVLFSVQDRQNPDFYEEVVLSAHSTADSLELVTS